MRSKGILKKKENIGSILLCISIVCLHLMILTPPKYLVKLKMFGIFGIIFFLLGIFILMGNPTRSKGILPFIGYNLASIFFFLLTPYSHIGVIYEKSILFFFSVFSFCFLVRILVEWRFSGRNWTDISFLFFPGTSLWVTWLFETVTPYTEISLFTTLFLFFSGFILFIYSKSIRQKVLILFGVTSLIYISVSIMGNIPSCTPTGIIDPIGSIVCYFLLIGILFSPKIFLLLFTKIENFKGGEV